MIHIPEYQDLMIPALQVLAGFGEPLDAKVLLDRLATRLQINDVGGDKFGDVMSVLENRLDWALTYLQRSKFIIREHDAFQISDQGREHLDKMLSAHLLSYSANSVSNEAGLDGFAEDLRDPEQMIASCHLSIYDRLKKKVLLLTLEQSPAFFENLIIDLLLAMGYGGRRRDLSHRLGRSGDGGLDGRVDQDVLGLDVVYVQAKRYNQGTAVPVAAVCDFAGALDAHKAAKGVFVTTSHFTGSARKFVNASSRRIVLIDGEMLAGLMIRYDIGVRSRETYVIKSIDSDYFRATA